MEISDERAKRLGEALQEASSRLFSYRGHLSQEYGFSFDLEDLDGLICELRAEFICKPDGTPILKEETNGERD